MATAQSSFFWLASLSSSRLLNSFESSWRSRSAENMNSVWTYASVTKLGDFLLTHRLILFFLSSLFFSFSLSHAHAHTHSLSLSLFPFLFTFCSNADVIILLLLSLSLFCFLGIANPSNLSYLLSALSVENRNDWTETIETATATTTMITNTACSKRY